MCFIPTQKSSLGLGTGSRELQPRVEMVGLPPDHLLATILIHSVLGRNTL